MEPATIISIFALVISLISTWFAVHSWRQAHRPLITARVSITGGNVAAALTIVVENTGNRPARNIKLSAREEDVIARLAPGQNRIIPAEISSIFFNNIVIPVLANSRSVSNAFGLINQSSASIWIPNFILPIIIYYEDIEGRKFTSNLNLQSAHENAFAGSSWSSPTS
jgi:hypothetical protein